jgi:hypothetical protein
MSKKRVHARPSGASHGYLLKEFEGKPREGSLFAAVYGKKKSRK